MAPRKKHSRAASRKPPQSRKVEAFLKDFDREVQLRVRRMRMERETLVKEIHEMYEMEILRYPVALREMKWFGFYAAGGCEQILEKAVSVDSDIQEITKLASEAIQTPLKTARRGKRARRAAEAISEETEPTPLPAGKRSRQQSEDPEAPQPGCQALPPKPGKAKASTRKPRPPSARSTRYSKRQSKAKHSTPAGQTTHRGLTVAPTPKCDPRVKADVADPKFLAGYMGQAIRIFRTPGLRTPAAHERVFSVSANGSPLADPNDIFITLPSGQGESLSVRARELSRRDLQRLDSAVLEKVQELTTHLTQLCSSVQKK